MLFANGCLQDCIQNVKGGRGERGERRWGEREEGWKRREIGRDDSIHLILRSPHLMIAMSNTGWASPVGTHTRLSKKYQK